MARIAGSDSTKTRALICEKALVLSAKTGFEALTMRDLAGACGIQVAAIYYYFPDKQSLLVSLLTVHYDLLLHGASAIPINAAAETKLLAFAKFHIEFHAMHRTQALLAAQELRSLTKANASLILPRRQAFERHLRKILNDGVKVGAFNIIDVALMSIALLAMLTEIAVWLREDGKTSLAQVADHYAKIILKMVVA